MNYMINVRPSTVLTNLQRGNVKQDSPVVIHQRSIHEVAAQGELYHLKPPVDLLDSRHMTPLFWAANYGQISSVELLLVSGANPNHRSQSGKTALMFAAANGYVQVVKSLINHGSDVNIMDEFGNTALIYACHQDQPFIVHELLANGADISQTNRYGQTAYSITVARHSRHSQAAIEGYLLLLLQGLSTKTKRSIR